MTFYLGTASRKELAGVHPSLVAVVQRSIVVTSQDFGVHDGLRTRAEQVEYVARGASETLKSKHLPQADGFGHAVDLVPYINGKLRWEWRPIYVVASAVQQAARELQVKLVWGGVWDRLLNELPGNLEKQVQLYVERRRARGDRRVLIDGPHFQLA